MANRSYLYALSNRPKSYRDRPEMVVGLSEWPYLVPFIYRLLLSGDTKRCASLLSEGLEDDAPDARTPLYAISGVAMSAMGRVDRFLDILVRAVGTSAPVLIESVKETRAFLAAHPGSHFLLETAELDLMTSDKPDDLRDFADEEVNQCVIAGKAVDALSRLDPADAAAQLREAVKSGHDDMVALKGLLLTDDFDNTRDNKTAYPLGISYWTNVLYFDLMDKQTFDAQMNGDSPP